MHPGPQRAVLHTTVADDVAAIAAIEAIGTILEVVCRTTGMGFAAVARVTEDRWVACAVRDEIDFGLQPGGELQVETTICHEIRESGHLVVIDHVAEDPLFCGHPTPARYGFQSYISVPILLVDGEFFGTLCALDPRPARVNTPEITGMFTLFADLIAQHLAAMQRTRLSEQALQVERQHAELREQFLAVLGHDLRNPLAAIRGSVQLLRRHVQTERALRLVANIQHSAARMEELVENVLDLTRARLGAGLSVTRVLDPDLQAMLAAVITEQQTIWPERTIVSTFTLPDPVVCDRARLAQVASNLVTNALVHGEPTGPVWVHAQSSASGLTLSVTNRGEPLAPAARERLFQPFWRGAADSAHRGLGLGLFIASEIAHAHDGTLTVTSNDEETCFTFWMPAVPAGTP